MSNTHNRLAKLYRSSLRTVCKKLRLYPTNLPYLSGDNFRSIATHHLDDVHSTISTNTNPSIIFVSGHLVEHFFSTIAPRLSHPYVLISNNADTNITPEITTKINGHLTHWFAQNCLADHPKITPLPIGLANKRLYLDIGMPHHFDRLRATDTPKQQKIFYKFNVATNPPERSAALRALSASPLSATTEQWIEGVSYLNHLNGFSFVASPAGNGIDCHRTWEAMYLKTVPILTRTPMATYFANLGLPLVVIDNWDELATWTARDLTAMYESAIPKFSHPALWMDYWASLIRTTAS
jgi:hypothetical protein